MLLERWNAIVEYMCTASGIILLANFNFQKIVELLNTVYCFAELLEFAAFIYLRIKLPHLYRPFKVHHLNTLHHTWHHILHHLNTTLTSFAPPQHHLDVIFITSAPP